MGIDCGGTKGISSLRCKDVIIRLNIHHIQFAGGTHIGCDKDAMSSGALCAVTGNRTHGEVLFANALGNEGRGTAAVTVGSPLTAQGQHSFAFLVRAETDRVIGTTTVVHNENERTVFLNTDHGAGSVIRTAGNSFAYKLAILNYHTEGYAYCMEKGTLCKVLFNFSLVICLYVTRDIAFCILEHIEDGGSSIQNSTTGCYILMCITDPLSIVDQNTGRIRIVVKVSIHTADNVVSEVILVILSHFGQFLVRPVSLIFQILIDLIVSRDDGYIGVRRVNLDHMEDLSAITGSIVQHDLGLNSCTGNEDVIFFRDHVVVAIGAEGFAVINYIVIRPVGDGCQRSCGQHADQRH